MRVGGNGRSWSVRGFSRVPRVVTIQRMRSIQTQLETLFRTALPAALGEAARGADPLIRRSQDPRFGDYQSNAAMGLAKALGAKPHDVAKKITLALAADPAFAAMCEPAEIAGPGFINLRLKGSFLGAALAAIPAAPAEGLDRLGIEPTGDPQRVVVDYSGPNIAKQMHVGHLRPTIIGDAIVRVLEFEGHEVIRQNHVGDWGLQMGQMLRRIAPQYAGESGERGEQAVAAHLEQIEREYRAAQEEEKGNPALAEESRRWVARLQSGDPEARRIWLMVRGGTMRACQELYDLLDVKLTEADVRGESFYNDQLAPTVEELRRKLGAGTGATIRVDQGALCVFHTDEKGEARFRTAEGHPLPMIIQKSDGAYLYATTDLAALRFRTQELRADRIIYTTDPRQKLHFEMVFLTARAAGWTRRDGREVRLDHVTFGAILGEDRKPLKTRSGENVRLRDVLDEAVSRAEQLVRANEADPAKRRGFDDEQIRRIARAVGIGAVKYADLCQNRTTDYVFSWDKMLAMDGNTAPYLMYAYARIRSIYAKSKSEDETTGPGDEAMERRTDEGAEGGKGEAHTVRSGGEGSMPLREPAELKLAKQILQFAEAIDAVADELRPNVLTSYLYDLAGAFMGFYESCPVLKAETPALRASRLRLCDLTARTLRTGLGLLGITVVERM